MHFRLVNRTFAGRMNVKTVKMKRLLTVKMKRLFACALCMFLLLASAQWCLAQSNRWRDVHKVKKKETLYSICRDYGITVEELKAANPEMNAADYRLRKGDRILIPQPSALRADGPAPQAQAVAGKVDKKAEEADVRKRPIRMGVMLPLHDVNGDGRRMVEYYRGVLMACDSLKKLGISTDVYAWNLAEDGSVKQVLDDPNAARLDLLIGPLYSKQVPELARFVEKHDIMMVIPFSINAPDVYTNRHIFQVYQNPNEQNESTVRRFCEWFKDYHPVIVDCGDSTSTKGMFTSALRRSLEQRGIKYSITNLKQSSDAAFLKAFATEKKNVVVLNTARSPELNATFGRLSAVATTAPDLHISMFGYTEWMMYATHQLENFYRYNVYMPTPFYTNLLSSATERLQQKYRWNFHQAMMQSLPRFALTGFDHAYFFLQGLHKYGKSFDGAAGRFGYAPVQTPLKFERVGNGGLLNKAYMFVHYLPEHQIETVNY